MIGVIVPACNEARTIERCLRSIRGAAAHALLHAEAVCVVVVADACTDATAVRAERWADVVLRRGYRCVGAARSAASAEALRRGCRWIASTDADCEVPADWLVGHLACGRGVFCGTVTLGRSRWIAPHVRSLYAARYDAADGHRHIHGANLGIDSAAYLEAGGFRLLPAHEDVALVRTLEARSVEIAWRATPSVKTSARLHARTPEGFCAYLNRLATIA